MIKINFKVDFKAMQRLKTDDFVTLSNSHFTFDANKFFGDILFTDAC